MIAPAKVAIINPGSIAMAFIFPNAIAEPVRSRTIHPTAMKLNPHPISEIAFPVKTRENVYS